MRREIKQAYRKAAEKYADKISKHRSVVGILFLDKPMLDKYDDIDVVVFAKNNVNIPKGESLHYGHDIDVAVINYNYAKKVDWCQETRSAFENAVILYDKNNKTKNLLKKKLVFSLEERKDMIVSNIFSLIWMGLYDSHRWKDYKIGYYPHNVWLKREGVSSADMVIDYGIDLLLDILYAYNKEFIPGTKWKLCSSYNLKWLPKDYKKRMQELLLTKAMTKKDFERRYSIFKGILKEIITRLEKENFLPENMYHYFLKHDPFYSLYPKM